MWLLFNDSCVSLSDDTFASTRLNIIYAHLYTNKSYIILFFILRLYLDNYSFYSYKPNIKQWGINRIERLMIIESKLEIKMKYSTSSYSCKRLFLRLIVTTLCLAYTIQLDTKLAQEPPSNPIEIAYAQILHSRLTFLCLQYDV